MGDGVKFDGPSPQAWGTLVDGELRRQACRAIPTGVGNSTCPAVPPAPYPGHPHRRGELELAANTEVKQIGPSPQAWGTRARAGRPTLPRRAIPTGVGNSSPVQRVEAPITGHPHRRGELPNGVRFSAFPRGPSPQAWGTLRPVAAPGPRTRAIPTGVGNSFLRFLGRFPLPGHPHRRGEL